MEKVVHLTVASTRLASWLLAQRGRGVRLARLLKVSPQIVSAWARGQKNPTPAHRRKIENETRIPAAAWDKPAPLPKS